MAHFAKLGIGNIVERVEVVSNDIATTEQAGVDFLNNLYGKLEMFGNRLLIIDNIKKKLMLVLVIHMTKLEMLLYHQNLLIVGH